MSPASSPSSPASTALVTGASSGIGVELAALLARDGHRVVLTSSPSSSAQLDEVAARLRSEHGAEVETISVDLAEPGAAGALHEAVVGEHGSLDVLVNNAGFGIVGIPVQDYDPAELSRMLQVNVLALSELTLLALPAMIQRRSGRILNVSSIAGYIVPHGLEAGYAATKAYVRSFSESVAHDLRGTGVTCTHVAPGPTRTAFFGRAGLPSDRRLERLYMEPREVAEIGYRAMLRGRSGVIAGNGNRALAAASTLSPSKRLTAAISGFFVER